MTATGRRPLVAGNWKMNPADRRDAVALAQAVVEAVRPFVSAVDVVLCPPAIWLDDVAAAVQGNGVAVGAQTMHAQDGGAFTGEISPIMVAGVASHVIIGHSERRRLFGETDADVATKVAAAVRHGLIPMAAVGESAEERRAGETERILDRQVRAAVSGLDRLAGSGLVVAYEPVWAIGTGDAASTADAQAGAAFIRGVLAGSDPDAAATVRILYGGSVAPHLAAGFFAELDVDGALVGGASLDATAFVAIVRAAVG